MGHPILAAAGFPAGDWSLDISRCLPALVGQAVPPAVRAKLGLPPAFQPAFPHWERTLGMKKPPGKAAAGKIACPTKPLLFPPQTTRGFQNRPLAPAC